MSGVWESWRKVWGPLSGAWLVGGCVLPYNSVPAPEEYFQVRNGMDRLVVVMVDEGDGRRPFRLLRVHAKSEKRLLTSCRGVRVFLVDAESEERLAQIDGPACPGDLWIIEPNGTNRLEKIPPDEER
ncbi:hypothetical protein LO762_27680 [Actinocorallia sp. API 0066]|uniref:hypothetical protein n=1 Tax=Actinocorallia sp. API 0066 TaxID=2896846 RepID=UPI001E467E30|nr:hypothetical protein [Actinocorallia sp. API 0066]MCD0452932.1 hypothetical protein [Actinocorallia sp. API 0066]